MIYCYKLLLLNVLFTIINRKLYDLMSKLSQTHTFKLHLRLHLNCELHNNKKIKFENRKFYNCFYLSVRLVC